VVQLAQLTRVGRDPTPGGAELTPAAVRPKADLLVLQPTPFCNIDCHYCYLPHRSRRDRMSVATARAALEWMLANDLVDRHLSIAWHGGEPLTAGPSFYREAFAAMAAVKPRDVSLAQRVQTNAMLVNDSWCDLFAEHDVLVGVSIDGPAFLHDARRVTRDNRGTHAAAMRGVERLLGREIRVSAICVLNEASLDHAEAIYEFFRSSGIPDIGFNIEEIEAAHTTSSLNNAQAEERVRQFFRHLAELAALSPGGPRIREIEAVKTALRSSLFGAIADNNQNRPFGIVSVDHEGSISTFSPELAGWQDARYGSFAWGSVHNTPLETILSDPRFQAAQRDIRQGVAMCSTTCPYFNFCLGGAPSNKLAETGTFATTETMFCRLTQKVVVDVVLEAIEDALDQPRESRILA
jgi:uncharacterized protein